MQTLSIISGLDAHRYNKRANHRAIYLLIEFFTIFVSAEVVVGRHGTLGAVAFMHVEFPQNILEVFLL